ncbi:MAG: type I restriction-modification system subunit M N-terminal domain-containing protein [Desulfobacteraceae bacterium]|jgi:type I restriction-modification system DNA methylase subunit
MPNGDLNWIANFIWGIADDVLRDVYVRGKYRDVILPMTVIRRLDAVLEPTKQDVLKMSEQLDKAGVANKEAALCQAAGPDANHAFYNDSPFHPSRPPGPRQAATAQGRFRSLSQRLFAQCSGDSGKIQVPQPDSHLGGG